jgi:hypothetical protein
VAGEAFHIDPGSVEAVGSQIAALGDLTMTRSWPGVGECRAPSVADAAGSGREWFRFGWDELGVDVGNGAAGAAGAARVTASNDNQIAAGLSDSYMI